MPGHLSLVESDFEKFEKRVLPRFPFCYLTFKCGASAFVYEVKDISHSGMQLELKNGEVDLKENALIDGEVHWHGSSLQLNGEVKWVRGPRIGVEFSNAVSQKEKINEFLSIENFAEHMRPLHGVDLGIELPPKLKYWARTDGPVEVFIWQHSDGELSKFQIIIMENFVEWADGEGLQTGRVISKRDVDTPLLSEDEFVFQIDPNIDDLKIAKAKGLITQLEADKLTEGAISFVSMKLGS